MSDKKIHVPLEFHNRDQAEVFAHFLRREARERPDAGLDFVAEQVEAALPPEYPEGTVAWVTGMTGHRTIAWREGDRWMTNRDEGALATSYFPDRNVTKVEPLRVLADDEVAVKRILRHMSAKDWRESVYNEYPVPRDNLALVYADALDAEATS